MSIVLEGPEKMVPREFPLPETGSDGLLLRVERVGICGTDPKIYLGGFHGVTFPMILGHEVVGHVEALGEKAAAYYGVKEGDRVVVEPYVPCHGCEFCLKSHYQLCRNLRCYGITFSCDEAPHLWGAYGEYMYVAPGSRLHLIDGSVPPEAACMASVIGNGVRWVRTKGNVRFGETVAVIGAGAQGLASVIAASEAGADPIIVLGLTTDRERFKLAKEFGADAFVDVQCQDALEAVKELTGGEMAHVVVDGAGGAGAMETGLKLLRPLGRYVLAGLSGFKPVPVVTDRIVTRELTVLGGYGQSMDVEPAVKIINSGKYAIEKMVTHTFRLAEADKAMNFFTENPSECIRVALDPWGGAGE